MENYEIFKNLESFQTRLRELEEAIDVEKLEESIASMESLIASPTFYSDMKNAEMVLKKVKQLKINLETVGRLNDLVSELNLYYDMQKNKEVTEEDINDDVIELIKNINEELSKFEIKMLLSNEYDDCDCIVELHPGAGGTESQDWASMLFRMYKRYAETKELEFEVLDYQDGDEAGIKSVTFMIKGEKAYGYLKSEHGVHRLVRISPFDSGARRHTSFCGCFITPVIEGNIDIEVKQEDIRIDTYRASGAGGQHINKTDSAIRITHIPTGIVVTCQSQRSQIQNREKAMEILKSKLYTIEREKQESKIKSVTGNASINGFGGEVIRSYVFCPYCLVKDNRTDYETANTQGVMDGDIDGFINAFLKSNYNR